MTGYREYRTRQEMMEHGWKINPLNSECRNCHGEITWATSPKGKKLPLDVNSTSLHFKSCTGDSSEGSSNVRQTQSGTPLRNRNIPSNDIAALRESLDECAQAVRELCRILRARTEATR
jgi:hypothetical protein